VKEVRMIRRLSKMGWIVLAALLSLVLVVLPACGGPAEEEGSPVITLTAATWMPATAGQSVMVEAFLEDLKTESGGQLDYVWYPGGSLLAASDLYEGCAEGLADIVMCALHYSPGRFPTMDALYQPIGISSAWVATHVINDFYEEFKPAEVADTHPLFWHGSAPLVMYTKEPVQGLADLDGMILRCGSSNNPILEALGATPSNIAMADVYEGISKNLLDGCMIGADGFTVWALGDVVAYATFPNVCGCDVFLVTMNNDRWNSLPADLQDVVASVSASYIDKACQMWEDENTASCNLGRSKGVEFITLSAEEQALWEDTLQAVLDNYVAARLDAGESQSEVEGWLDYIAERVDYWTQEQIDAGIPFLP
jgi:TRAP-type C4-dicarboxylate transport system substrate-binding protein